MYMYAHKEKQGIITEKKYPYDYFVVSNIQLIVPETQQPIIVIVLIIYSPYFLKDLVEH